MISNQVFFHSKSLNPNINFSLERYFLYHSSEEIVFFYVNKPSLILGNFQCVYKEVKLPNDMPIFRRLSGGGCVYHDEGNLNIAIFSKKEQSVENLLWVQKILKFFGKSVEISSRKDLMYENKKCSGSAFKHVNKRYLHHLTLLCSSNLDLLQKNLQGDDSIKTQGIPSVKSFVSNIHLSLESFLSFFPIQKTPLVPFFDFSNYETIFRKVPFVKEGFYKGEPYRIEFSQGKIFCTYKDTRIKNFIENFDFLSEPNVLVQDFLKQVLYYDFALEQLRIKDHELENFYQ